MAEIVGTAFVRIKALTDKLAGEIEDGLNRGAADVDISDAAESLGEDFGESFADGTDTSLKKWMPDVFNDSIEDIDKKTDVDEKGQSVGSRLANGLREGIRKSFEDDDGLLNKIGDRLKSALGMDEEGGEKSGGLFAKGFRASLPKLAAIFSPALLSAGSALLQYIFSLVGQIGYLGTAIAGASAALGGMLTAGVAAAGVLFLAFKTSTPALEEFKEESAEILEQFKEIGAATQQTLLPGLADYFRRLTVLIPILNGFGRGIGTIVNRYADLLSAQLTDAEGQDRIRRILQGMVGVVDNMFLAVYQLGDAFSQLLVYVLPLAERLSQTFANMADHFQNFIRNAAESGELARTLDDWYYRAELVFGALGDILVGLFNILKVGADTSGSFFKTFDEWAERFRAFTSSEEGQNKLAKIFEQAHAIAHEFNGLVTDIFKAINDGVFDGEGGDGILGFIRVLREDVVPFLNTFITDLFENYGPSLSRLFESIGKLLGAIDSKALAITLEVLSIGITILAEALDLLLSIPGVGDAAGLIISIAGAIKLLSFATFGLSDAILAPIKTFIVTVAAPAIGEGLATAAIGLASFAGSLGAMLGLSGFAAVAGGLGLILLAAAAVAGIAYLIYRNWGTIKEFFGDIVDFVRDKWDILLAVFVPIIGIPLLIIRNWKKLKKFFGDLYDTIKEKLGQALDKAKEFGGDFIDFIIDEVKKLPGRLRDLLVDAIKLAIEGAKLALIANIVGLIAIFYGIPKLILDALVAGIPIVIDFFQRLPGRVIGALDAFGDALYNFITQTVWPFVMRAFNMGVQLLIDLFINLPIRVVQAIAGFGRDLANFITQVVWPAVTSAIANFLSAVIQFFIDLPGNVVEAVSDFGSALASFITDTAWPAVQEAVSNGIQWIIDTITDLPGNIAEAASGLWNGLTDGLGDIVDGVARGLNGIKGIFIDVVNSAIRAYNRIPGLPDINTIDDGKSVKGNGKNLKNYLGLAQGGIFNSPTFAQIGEAGREVVIPLTKPKRALELVVQSGLFDTLRRAGFGGDTALGSVGDGGVSGLRSLVNGLITGGSSSSSIAFANGSIVVNISTTGGVSAADAQVIGANVAIGINNTLANRQANVDARTSRGRPS